MNIIKTLNPLPFTQIILTRCYARKVNNFPIKVDPKITTPKEENRRNEISPESLFLSEIVMQENAHPSIEQVHYLAERRKMEINKLKKKMYFKTIEKKYFKHILPKEPNLLTWEMKQHMKNLHSVNPEVWNPLSLSYAFPMSPSAIKKILNLPLQPLTAEKLKEHDLEVVENWKVLTEDKMGNYALLKRIINKRISTINNKNSLPVPSNISEDSTKAFEDFIFTPTEDETVDEIRANFKLPNVRSTKWRQKRPSFKDIITKYNELRHQSTLVSSESSAHVEAGKDVAKLRQSFTRSKDTLDSPDSQVVIHYSHQSEIAKNRPPIAMRHFKDRVTLEEYKHLKNLNSNK